MGYLEALRESIGDGMGFDKREPFAKDEYERLIDETINAMSITELLWQLDLIDDVKNGKFS